MPSYPLHDHKDDILKKMKKSELEFSELSGFPFWKWKLDFPLDEVAFTVFPSQDLFRDEMLFEGEIFEFWEDEEIMLEKKHDIEVKNKDEEMKRTKREDITFEEVAKHFLVPINEAAKELNVGITLLKKRCRELNIPRWPHRKMKSLDTLIKNIKEFERIEELRLEKPDIKATLEILEEEKRTMKNMPRAEFNEKIKRLRQACFKANYRRKKLMTVKTTSDQLNGY